jgi:serine phosphatase RsbU (regulator of sigma subunit)
MQKSRIFKSWLILFTMINLGCAAYLAHSLFQQVTDENLFTDYGPGQIVVIQVAPGGASDRAGLQEGDLITKINHQSFSDKFTADAIMRHNKPGSTIQYDILRDGQPMQIFVQLARIRVRLYYLFLGSMGLLFLVLGLFVGFKRPENGGARVYALGWVFMLPFLFSIGTFYRPDPDAFRWLIRYTSICLLAGITFSQHAHFYFPVFRFQNPKDVYLVRYSYWILAGTSLLVILLVITSPQTVVVQVIPLVIYLLASIPVLIKINQRTRADYRKITRKYLMPLKISLGVLLPIISILTFARPETPNFAEYMVALLLLFPLGHLYLIHKYHAFDIYFLIRRPGIYRIVNFGLILVSILAYFALVSILTQVDFNLPTIYFHGTSIEFLWSSDIPQAQRIIFQRMSSISLGILFSFILYAGFQYLKKWLDHKFYRQQYDYKKTLSEFFNLIPAAFDIPNFSRDFLDRFVDLMHLKGALLLHQGQIIGQKGIDLADANELKSIRFTENLPFPVTQIKLPEERQRLQKAGIEFIVPVSGSGAELCAVLFCGEKLSESNYNQEDVDFLHAISNYILITLKQLGMHQELQEKQRIANELRLARKIQRESLPAADPDFPPLETASFVEPAYEVGGDYFDYFRLSDSRLGVIIGDVSGKGTSAALHVAKIQGILRSLFPIYPDPVELFKNLNNLLYLGTPKNTFFTAIGSVFDTENAQVKFVRAGHAPLIYYNAREKSAQYVVSKGIGLGMVNDGKFANSLETQIIHYHPNDIFILYTDGLTEMMNDVHLEYGESHIIGILENAHQKSAREIRETIVNDVLRFKGEHPQHDDLTFIVIKIKPTEQ